MNKKSHLFFGWLLLACCMCACLAACGENSPRKFAQGFRELRWHTPRASLQGPARQLAPEKPLFPFEAAVLVRDNEARSLGQIPATRIAYAFADAGLQAVRVDFSPKFLVLVRKYFEDCYGQGQKIGGDLRWEGYGVRIRLFAKAPDGPFVLITGPATE